MLTVARRLAGRVQGRASGARGDSTRPRLIALIFVGIITALIFLPVSRLGVDPHHQGLILKEARDALSGQLPFRDSFNQYGILTPYLQAPVLWVFGDSLLALNFGVALAYGVIGALAVALWSRLIPFGAAICVWAVALIAHPEINRPEVAYDALHPWPSVYALALSLAAALLMIRAIERQSVISGLVSGCLVALTLATRTPVGLAVAAALFLSVGLASLWLATPVRRVLLGFLAGFAGLLLLGVVALAGAGALGPAWTQLVVEPRRYAENFGSGATQMILALLSSGSALVLVVTFVAACLGLRRSPIPAVWAWVACLVLGSAWTVLVVALAARLEPWVGLPNVFGAAGVVALGLLAGAAAVALLGEDSRAIAARWFRPTAAVAVAVPFAVLSAAQVFPITDLRHRWWALLPALGLLVWFLMQILRPFPWRAMAIVGILVVPGALWASNGAVDTLTGAWVNPPSSAVTSGMKVRQEFNDEYGTFIRALVRAHEARPNAPILNDGNDGLWSAFGRNVSNPDPYFLSWPSRGNPERRADFIWRQRPLIILGYGDRAVAKHAAASIGYRITGSSRGGLLPGVQRLWLLTPGPAPKAPPYRWDPSWGPPPFWTIP